MTEQRTLEPPTFAECVIGYRCWNINALGQLESLRVGWCCWARGVNHAQCELRGFGVIERHAAPQRDCSCGLYACHALEHVLPVRRGGYPTDAACRADGVVPVVGAVAAFGNLQVHPNGFRAERAGVVALAFLPGMGDWARKRVARIARRYGVACVDLAELEREAHRHGAPLPESVRPTWDRPEVDLVGAMRLILPHRTPQERRRHRCRVARYVLAFVGFLIVWSFVAGALDLSEPWGSLLNIAAGWLAVQVAWCCWAYRRHRGSQR